MISNKENQNQAILQGKKDIEYIKENYKTISEQKEELTKKINELKLEKEKIDNGIQQKIYNLYNNTQLSEDEIDTYMENNYSDKFLKYDFISYQNRELVMFKDKLSHKSELTI